MEILKLQSRYFDFIRDGTKRIEIRLNDAKRQAIRLGDVIEFRREPELTESLRARVVGLLHYPTFAGLIDDFDISLLADKSVTKAELLRDLNTFYAAEKQAEFGVVGIRFILE